MLQPPPPLSSRAFRLGEHAAASPDARRGVNHCTSDGLLLAPLPRVYRIHLWTALMAVLVVAGCSSNRNARIGESIQQILTAKPSTSAESIRAEVDRFYKARQYAPIWVMDGDLSKVVGALGVLRSAEAHGLVASDYGEETI